MNDRTVFQEAANLWMELVGLASLSQWKDSRLNRLAAKAWRRVLRRKPPAYFLRRL